MIGVFVIIAVGVLAASIVIFGSGDLFREKTEFVLYFEGSVKGLSVGSPVLYRGVQVGVVNNIVIRSYAKDLKSYIPVFIEVYPEKFEVITEGEDIRVVHESVGKLIEMGLRAQLVPQSMITGQLLIEVDMRPGTPANLKSIDTDYTEIPTIPSTLAKLGKSLEKFDLTEINTRLISILTSADRLLNNENIDAALQELMGILQDGRGLVQNVNAKVDPLAENLNSTLTDARGLVNNVEQEVKPLTGRAKTTLDDIGKLARHVDGKVDPFSKSVTEALKSVDSAFKSIDGLVGTRSPTRVDLDNTLKELAGAARSLRVLADYLERHPDALIKGKSLGTY